MRKKRRQNHRLRDKVSLEKVLADNFALAEDTSFIRYREDFEESRALKCLGDLPLLSEALSVSWLNMYWPFDSSFLAHVIKSNKIDEFVLNLVLDEGNSKSKLIELKNCFYVSVIAPVISDIDHKFERISIICGQDFLWTIQEKKEDAFGEIRKKIKNKSGLVRYKGVDYLFYLVVECILENYYLQIESIWAEHRDPFDTEEKLDFAKAKEIRVRKSKLFVIRQHLHSLKEAIFLLSGLELDHFKSKYANELYEQVKFLLDQTDFHLAQLDSNINMIFSMQNQQLNETMRTLTVFSAIFIPLTFIAGIYGMNFKNMPELESVFGYPSVLILMLAIAVFIVSYFKRRGYFR